MKRALGSVLILALLIGAWELYVEAGGADPLILPPPHEVAHALYSDRSLLWSNFLVTAREVLLGAMFAVAVGLALAVAIHLSETLRRAIYPLLIASQTIPIVMVVPILLFWLGFGLGPKLVVIGLVSFFPVVVATLDGLQAVDPDLIKLMRTFDAPRLRILRHVELPSALPGMLTGAKIAVAVAVIGAVFAELSGADAGLGYIFQLANGQLLPARAFASVAVLSAFAIALFALLTLIERLALPWAKRTTGEPNA